MAESKNYNWDFKPDLKLEDFSKDFLIRMMHAWAAAYVRLSEIWQGKVAAMVGDQKVTKLHTEVWETVAELTLPKITKALDIQVRDIVDFMKVTQIIPDGTIQGVYEANYDIKSRNHVVFTVTRCRTLEFLEKKAPERIVPVCHQIEIPTMEAYLRAFLPNAEVKPLKMPPRKSPKEIACVWEFKLQPTA